MVHLPGVSCASSSVPPCVDPCGEPLTITSHSAGAQLIAIPPVGGGLGGGVGAAAIIFALLLIASSVSADAPAAFSLSILSWLIEKSTPRLRIACWRRC